jgi:hypothetical protein
VALFDLVFQSVASLHAHGEPSDFLTKHVGIIRCTREDGKIVKVGKIRAYRIHADLANSSGEFVFDVCDAHSNEMLDLYTALFNPEDEDYKPHIRDQFDGFDRDVLVLDYILLSPKWRGLKLGLLATRKAIDLLGGGCGLVASYIAPLNPDAAEFSRVPRSWIPRHADPEDLREARGKLRRYFRRMGFERIGRTNYHGLSLAKLTPTLADLLQPGV